MKLYFVATRTGNQTDVEPFTSFVKQQQRFIKRKKQCKAVEDTECWMFGPIDFPLNKEGILKAIEFGQGSGSMTVEDEPIDE